MFKFWFYEKHKKNLNKVTFIKIIFNAVVDSTNSFLGHNTLETGFFMEEYQSLNVYVASVVHNREKQKDYNNIG